MIKILSYLFIFQFFIFGCNASQKTEINEVETIEVEEVIPEKIQSEQEVINLLPKDLGDKLYAECTTLEGSFYNTSKSINLWGENLKYVFSFITGKAPSIIDNNIVGHIMFLKDGEEKAFVELSFKDGVNYMIFNVDDNKYYNLIDEKGAAFFGNLIQ